MFIVSAAWKAAYAGVLIMHGVKNPTQHPLLDDEKTSLECQLRSRFPDRKALDDSPQLNAYQLYYRRFKKTYHVKHQIESIVFDGKHIPGVAALVEAMFMAELNSLLLTAGHDLDSIYLPITLDISNGSEQYIVMRGVSQQLKAGDMIMVDGEGVISSIIYGPDQRTQIQPLTKNVIFTTYAPLGIDEAAIRQHMRDIQKYVNLVAPDAQVKMMEVFQ